MPRFELQTWCLAEVCFALRRRKFDARLSGNITSGDYLQQYNGKSLSADRDEDQDAVAASDDANS
jgi:hypothetical protein